MVHLAGILRVEVGKGGHARGVWARLVVLLLGERGVDGCKLALQPLYLQCSHPLTQSGTAVGKSLFIVVMTDACTRLQLEGLAVSGQDGCNLLYTN